MKAELITTISIIGGLTVIQIAPLKINPWSFFAKCIKKLVGYYDLVDEINKIKTDIYELKKSEAEREYETIRNRVIKFAKEVNEDTTEEEYQYIYDAIKRADRLCNKYHIINGKFKKAIEKIDIWYVK